MLLYDRHLCLRLRSEGFPRMHRSLFTPRYRNRWACILRRISCLTRGSNKKTSNRGRQKMRQLTW
jgi:hypothetical protein